jgi:tetratricopeptide (TPR) repeat protein
MNEQPDDERLLLLAEAVAEGFEVNWADAEKSATNVAQRDVIEQLRMLARVFDSQRAGELESQPAPDVSQTPTITVERWGPLALRDEVGRGTFGTVFRAWDLRLDREVALKLLHRSASERPQMASAIIEEGRLLARVRHANVVTIYGADRFDGRVGLWMEFIHGKTLKHVLRERGPLGAREATLIGIDLCRALAAVHKAGLVHRDVKAENVMQEDGGRLVLMDFGAGREDLPPQDRMRPSITGTPLYMAPEILDGADTSARDDLYSLGVLLFHLVTGLFPVSGSSLEELRLAHKRRQAVHLRDLRPDLPTSFVRVVEQATSFSNEERFATAGAMERVLDRGLSGETSSHDESVIGQLPEFEPGTRVQTAAGIHELRTRAPDLAAPSVYRRRWLLGRWAAAAAAVAAVVVIVAALAVRYWPLVSRTDGQPPSSAGVRRSIAIIGFRNVSGRPEAEWLSTALSQMLTTELAGGDRLRMIPGETIAGMRTELALADADSFGKDTLRRIRRNLGTDIVGLGSFVLVGDQADAPLRVDLRLQDAVSGETIASIAETGALTNLLELAPRLGRRLREELGIPETPGESRSLPAAPEAARLYAEGLAKLWRFDARGARDLLSKATAIEPSHALVHSALAAALADLGEDAKARDEAKKAFELSAGLSRQNRLWIEGRYRETAAEWERAAELYKTLFEFYSDNEEYGLRLGEVLISGGKARDALATIATLRRLPQPAGDDPRIDLLESRVAESLSDFEHERASAQKAIDKAIANGASLVVARSRIAEAWALKNLGQPEKAIAANEEARRLYSAAGDQRGVSRALVQIGATFREQAKFTEATEAFTSALKLARGLGDKRQTLKALNGLASVLFDQGHFAEARRFFEQSLALSREVGDKLAIAQTLDNLASVLYEQGDITQSARFDAESLALRREIGERRGIAASLANMAEVLADQGNLPMAKQTYTEALTLYREIGNKTMEAYSLAGLGTVLLAEGDLVNARKTHEQAHAIREGLGNRDAAAESALALAELSLDEGAAAAARAEKMVREALDHFEKAKRTDQAARAYVVLARTLAARDDRSGARQAIDRAVSLGQQSESRGTRLSVQIAAAQIRATVDPEKSSVSAIEELIQETKKSGQVSLEFEARLARGQVQIQSGDAAGARADLQSLEKTASAKGFKRVVQKARALRHASAVSTPKRTAQGRQ